MAHLEMWSIITATKIYSIFEECSDIVPVYKRLRKQGELNFLTAEWLLEFRSNQEIGLAFLESLNVQTSINSSSQYK